MSQYKVQKIREKLWNGALNIQITFNPSIIITELPKARKNLNIRAPRESYLALYLLLVFEHIKDYLNTDTQDEGCQYWFEYNGTPIPWNYPLGVVYDAFTKSKPFIVKEKANQTAYTICIWKLQFNCGRNTPSSILPLVNGKDQVRNYWYHQWKQACYLLNGSSKAIMSLSMTDSKQFWSSVINHNFDGFNTITNKVIPTSLPKTVPVVLYRLDSSLQCYYPPQNEAANDPTLLDMILYQFPDLKGNELFVLCQGVEIPIQAPVRNIYYRLMSFDGFLHLVINVE